MTHIYKLLLAMLLCIVPASQMYSQILIDGLYYNLDETSKTATVTYKDVSSTYNSTYVSGDLVIPSTVEYNGISYQVTSIGSSAFSHCSGLTSVTIPASVTSIGENAFYGCNNHIKAEFSSIESLCNITFNGIYSNPLYYAHHLFINGEEVTDLVIPASVTSIGKYAFSNCSGLTSITIPASVTSIGGGAFSSCSGLTSVTIPASVTSIGSSAFRDCSNLFDVTINSEALISAERTSSTSLASVFGTQVKEYVLCNKVTSLGSYVFEDCSGLTSITIPESVTSIGSSAFEGCYRLSKIICLSSIPPSCNGTSTFECSIKVVRDKYDIYNYATLHVPMGSKEAYSSAYEWRYFNNIKEDMESNGQVFYANLMVKQGTTGYTRQPIKVEEKYTFYIGSLGEYKVNAVTFNGVDVTDEVNNGYYTTPEIKGESVLSISYETASAVGSVTLNKVKVTGYDGEINISNIDEPSDVSIYSTDGKLIDNVSSAYGEAKIYVPSEQLYIVKVGTRTFKVAL